MTAPTEPFIAGALGEGVRRGPALCGVEPVLPDRHVELVEGRARQDRVEDELEVGVVVPLRELLADPLGVRQQRVVVLDDPLGLAVVRQAVRVGREELGRAAAVVAGVRLQEPADLGGLGELLRSRSAPLNQR